MRLLTFIALRQLWARKGLYAIALGGVALGVLVLVTMRAILGGLRLDFRETLLRATDQIVLQDAALAPAQGILQGLLGELVVARVKHDTAQGHARGIQRPDETLRMIRGLPGVVAACGRLEGHAVLSFGTRSNGVALRGMDPKLEEGCTSIGRFLRQGSWREFAMSRDGILIGSLLAQKLGVTVGDRVQMVAAGGVSQTLRVLGIFEVRVNTIDRTWVYAPLEMVQAALGTKHLSAVGVRVRDAEDAPLVGDRLERLTGNQAESWQEANAASFSVFRLQDMVVGFQIAAILVVGGFGVLAVQIMLVLQKARDISILRAIGLTRGDILRVFLLQGFLVAFAGALVGDLLAWRLIALIEHAYDRSASYQSGAQLPVVEIPSNYLVGLLFALVIGTLSSFLPAWRGARLDPVQVLRGQIG